jgi:hypothetical protein
MCMYYTKNEKNIGINLLQLQYKIRLYVVKILYSMSNNEVLLLCQNNYHGENKRRGTKRKCRH